RAGARRESRTACFDEERAGRHSPGLQIDLGVDLGLALGHEAVADVVAEAALAIGGVDQTDEAVPVTRPPQQAEARVDQMGLTDPGHVGDANALAVEERAPAPAPRVDLTGQRIVDDTARDLARFLQRDRGRPAGDAAAD